VFLAAAAAEFRLDGGLRSSGEILILDWKAGGFFLGGNILQAECSGQSE
jgi:hypothetical protein